MEQTDQTTRSTLSVSTILCAAIGVYQRWISPFLPPHCRFYPTCSTYARDAIRSHGIAAGGWLAIKRIGRCHPLCQGGHDPVPNSSND